MVQGRLAPRSTDPVIYVLLMARTAKVRKRWKVIGGSIFVVTLAVALILGEIGASEAARGLGLALLFLVWPLIFLAAAPPAKPGLDPVTAMYYHPTTIHRPNAFDAPNPTQPARPDDDSTAP